MNLRQSKVTLKISFCARLQKKGELEQANPFARQMVENWRTYAEKLNRDLIKAKTQLVERDDEIAALRRHHEQMAQEFYDAIDDLNFKDDLQSKQREIADLKKRLKSKDAEYDFRSRKIHKDTEIVTGKVAELLDDKPLLSVEGAKFLKSPSGKGLSGRDGGDSRRCLKPDLEAPCGPRPPDGSIVVRAFATKPT